MNRDFTNLFIYSLGVETARAYYVEGAYLGLLDHTSSDHAKEEKNPIIELIPGAFTPTNRGDRGSTFSQIFLYYLICARCGHFFSQ